MRAVAGYFRMKIFSLAKVIVLAVCGATFLAPVAQADPRASRKPKSVLDQNEEERYVMVTGSNIPQKIKLKSIGTTTPYNLRIYSQRELLSSGRQSVGGALSALDPSISVSGR